MPVRPHQAREYLRTPEDVTAHLNAAIEELDGDPRLLRKVPERRGLPLLQSNLSSRIVQLPKRKNLHQNRRWSFPHPAPRLRRLTELSPLATSWSCGHMVGEVNASFRVPSTSSCEHEPPSLIRVRARRSFAPSDSVPAAAAPAPLASSLPRGGCLFATGRTRTHRRGPQGPWSPALPDRPLPWRFGTSQVTLASPCVRACPRSNTPPGGPTPHPFPHGGDPAAFGS